MGSEFGFDPAEAARIRKTQGNDIREVLRRHGVLIDSLNEAAEHEQLVHELEAVIARGDHHLWNDAFKKGRALQKIAGKREQVATTVAGIATDQKLTDPEITSPIIETYKNDWDPKVGNPPLFRSQLKIFDKQPGVTINGFVIDFSEGVTINGADEP